jgi:hypothetical protein
MIDLKSTKVPKEQASGITLVLSIIAILSYPFSLIWNSHVLQTLWLWFITPTYGVPAPSLAVGVGLLIILGLLFNRGYREDTRTALEKVFYGLSVMWIAPAVSLLMGWIVTLFM